MSGDSQVPSQRFKAKSFLTLATAFVLLLLLGVITAGWRIAQVHGETWEWRLSPSAAPPRVGFDGRHYIRTDVGGVSAQGMQQAGQTSGGAPIYVGPQTPGCVPTGIVVLDNSRAWQYSLSGGPC